MCFAIEHLLGGFTPNSTGVHQTEARSVLPGVCGHVQARAKCSDPVQWHPSAHKERMQTQPHRQPRGLSDGREALETAATGDAMSSWSPPIPSCLRLEHRESNRVRRSIAGHAYPG